jgi:PAS domain S-box-containing protein
MEIDIDKKLVTAAVELRRRAEEQLQANATEESLPLTGDETQRLVHELEVHQIELEMQNSELRLARDEVEKELENYTDLYDFAPVGYVTLDRKQIIHAVNLTGATLLGIERTRLIGRNFGQFVASEARQRFSEFLRKVFVSQTKDACELALLKEEKQALFVQIEAVASASGLECRIGIIDISVRRQLAEKLEILHTQLAARASELAAANIELEAFNYTVSHDLRRPLTIIGGYCQLLRELSHDQLDEQSKGYLREISEGVSRMNRLIAALLDFSRVTRVEIHREQIDLSEMAKKVATELIQAAPESPGAFRIAEGITTNGDAGLWRIVLDNLIGNAWKYTLNREETIIEFGMTEREGKPVCFIRDNGPGFDMADAEKLFIPFQRLNKTAIEGDGIGLATVQRIILRHGGRVWAESGPGMGATFLFTLEEPQ